MKMFGKKNLKPDVEIAVVPRREGNLVFKAQPVTEFDDFDKLCPMPQAPIIQKRGGEESRNVEDVAYKASLDAWATMRTDWMIVKSLQATEGLEWETVNLAECSTWTNYKTELMASGLTPIEINTVIQAVVDACGLNQKKIDEATKSFLAGQAALLAKL
jgi:hypothetical protein